MAISSLSRGSTAAASPNQNEQRRQLLELVKAIHSGDLAGAQQAFGQISQAHQGNPADPVTQALASIGDALQSGNIDGAKQALGALKERAQAAVGQHHPYGSYGSHRGDAGSYVSVKESSSGAPATATPASTGHTLDVTV